MAPDAPVRRNLTPVRVVAVNDGVRSERPDTLATEEPMEIRAGGPGQEAAQVAVTMRTPGGDYELAVGFLFTEGLIAPGDVRRVAYCDDLDDEAQRFNVVTVTLERPFDAAALRRNFFATSSCGICGKAALDDVEVRCAPVAEGPQVRAEVLIGLPEALRAKQKVFDRTGGLHAAGLFTAEGELVTLREDVGRHNAVDKVIGEQVLAGRVPLIGPRAPGQRARQLRDRAEGRGGRDPDRERRQRAVVTRRRGGGAARHDDRRLRPRRALQRLRRRRARPHLRRRPRPARPRARGSPARVSASRRSRRSAAPGPGPSGSAS